jgi:hypothetical protein
LLSFLDKNNDVFTWRTSNLTGVSRDTIEHKLHVNLSAKPRKQRLRKMSDEKVVAAKAEFQRLWDAGFIREVHCPSWLMNAVMVRKKNGKWRMCTDFTDLNKYCSKDDFLLSRIDKVVDSPAGSEIMALLDYFLWYHKLWLRKEDEEKTNFITPFGTYCYLRMPVSWFVTRFESTGAHRCDEQWNMRNMRVYTGLGLPEDNSPMSCVHRLYYDCLGRDPLYPYFYMPRGVGFTWKIQLVMEVPNPDSISTCPIYKICFYSYLLNYLGHGPPSPCH